MSCSEAPCRSIDVATECSQPTRIKPAWFLSKPLDQLANGNAVVVQGRIAGAPLPTHPLTK